VGGSTVLHYDRWWNAAREDQATDRVHRIGQRRAVQVFKLVTEGTLEEKISAIIDRKRRLMNAVVQADNPHLSKIFSREELMALLQPV
jgi:SNF2 family DNA or RNA helicase